MYGAACQICYVLLRCLCLGKQNHTYDNYLRDYYWTNYYYVNYNFPSDGGWGAILGPDNWATWPIHWRRFHNSLA